MANLYWKGLANNGIFDQAGNWWTTLSGTTTGTVPGAADTAVFNADTLTTTTAVYLGSNRVVGTLWFNGNWKGSQIRGGNVGFLGANTITINNGIDLSGASGDLLFYYSTVIGQQWKANVVLGGNQTWSIASGRKITVDSVMSGAFKLTVAGTGTLVLNNSNTYGGGTETSSATIRVGNNNALGASTLTMTGGCIASTSTIGYDTPNAITINGNVTFGDSINTGYVSFGGTPTIAGPSSITSLSDVYFYGNLAGSSNLTTDSTAAFIFVGQGVSSYTGALKVNSGVIIAGQWNSGVATQLNSASSIELVNPGNGRIWYRGTAASSTPVTHRGSGGIYSMNSAGMTFTGNLSTFTGFFEVYSDGGIASPTAIFGTASSFPVNAAYMAYSSWGLTSTRTQTFKYTGSSSVVSSVPIRVSIGYNGSTAVLDHSGTNNSIMSLGGTVFNTSSNTVVLQLNVSSTAGALTLSGSISDTNNGVMGVSKTGAGTLILSGINNYNGSTTVTAGTLALLSADALSNASNLVLSTGTTFLYHGSTPFTRDLNLTSQTVGGNATFGSNITVASSHSNVLYAEKGTLTLSNLTLVGQATFSVADPESNVVIGNLTSSYAGTGARTFKLNTVGNSSVSGYRSLIAHSSMLTEKDFTLNTVTLPANQIAILASDTTSVGLTFKNI